MLMVSRMQAAQEPGPLPAAPCAGSRPLPSSSTFALLQPADQVACLGRAVEQGDTNISPWACQVIMH